MKSSKTEKKQLDFSEVEKNLVPQYFDSFEELDLYKKEITESKLIEHLIDKSNEFSNLLSGKNYRGYDYELADIGIEQGIYLYCILRKLSPLIAVETGVCNGYSTAFLLLALSKNNQGKLYSLDFPEVAGTEYPDNFFWEGKRGAVIPKQREPGWVIPDDLKRRWSLTIGKSQNELPILLQKLKQIDFFLHDSEHSYECQMFECKEAYKFLRKGGILMLDDMSWNNSFKDFTQQQNKDLIALGDDLGLIIK